MTGQWMSGGGIPFRCPVCEGRQVVAWPPGTATGAWVGSSTGPWPCQVCAGTGGLWRFVVPWRPDGPQVKTFEVAG